MVNSCLLAAGQGSAAVVEFQKILDHSGIVWNCWTGTLARLGVARANAFHLGFDDELVARLPDGALRRQLLKGVPDRPGIGAADACLELEFHLVFLRLRSGNVTAQEAWGRAIDRNH
jgi:hypothetical protein